LTRTKSPSPVLAGLRTVFASLPAAALGLSIWGYFSPWLAARPAGLQLSAHDLVEWLTFVQTVRDGTFPVSRLDMSLPLAGLAILVALTPAFYIAGRPPRGRLLIMAPFLAGAWLLALLALPPYPFVLTAYRDPELQPQFWLSVLCAVLAPAALVLAWRLPKWALAASALLSVLTIALSWRAFNLAVPPLADALTKSPGAGYGLLACLAGGLILAAAASLRFWQMQFHTCQ
jgi:hypothetical protein